MTTAEEHALAPPKWREVFAGARGRLTAGLLLLEALVAIEALIVVTILPEVENDLGGLALYGWTFTALTLASFATVPIAGRLVDRVGPTPVLTFALALYVGGLLIAALAPSMFVLVCGRFVQGIGGGGLYVVSLSAVAKTYPERIRPRVMALLASMWILPGLFGPIIGSVIAESVGWRWAFVAPIPAIIVGVAMVIPSLGSIGSTPNEDRLPVAASLLLMFGAGVFLAGLTDPTWPLVVLVPIGLAVGLPALSRITPRGTFVATSRAARGGGRSVPRFVRVPRCRRVPHADADESARAVDRSGRLGDHRCERRMGCGELVRVADRRPAWCAQAGDDRRARDRDRNGVGRRRARARPADRRARTSAGRSAGSAWAWSSRRSRWR